MIGTFNFQNVTDVANLILLTAHKRKQSFCTESYQEDFKKERDNLKSELHLMKLLDINNYYNVTIATCCHEAAMELSIHTKIVPLITLLLESSWNEALDWALSINKQK